MADLRIPKPEIHTGPKHMTVDEATIHYLREAAERVRAARIWGSGVSALVATVLDDTAAALLASSAPATASEDATLSDSDTDSVTSSDGDRGLSEEWGHAHADEPDAVCVTRTEALARACVEGWNSATGSDGKGLLMRRLVGPWEVVGDE